MFLLIVSIVIALLITIGLPIAASIWLNKKLGVPWHVISYGALAYFIAQALVTLLIQGGSVLVQNAGWGLSDTAIITGQIILSVILAALLGSLARWAAIKFLKEDLENLESGYGLGVGYGGVESIMLVGLPLLTTFIAMLSNMNIDPQTTSLDPAVIEQIEALWQVSPFIPLAGALERFSAFVMHITVTILVLQVFKRKRFYWLWAAIGLELLVNGLVVGLSEAGVMVGWVVLVSVFLMVGNFYILYRLNAFDIDITRAGWRRENRDLS